MCLQKDVNIFASSNCRSIFVALFLISLNKNKTRMKLRLLPLLVLANVTLFAQTTVENLSMGPGYANDIYYSLENGVMQTTVRNDWHIAFTKRIVDAAILTNTVEGVDLYVGSTDIADWPSFDTTGMSWTALHNSDKEWEVGSFNAPGGTNIFDFGWGDYNQTTNNVIGTKIFVMKLPDGSFRKILIENMLKTGDYNFKIANLDGSNEVTKTINKSGYPGVPFEGNFFYYDVLLDTAFSKEPPASDWDLVFTKYEGELSPGVYYGVTGALKNINTKASVAKGVDTNSVDWNNYPVKDTIKNIIGYDWKSFAGGWVLADSTSFFVEAKNGDLYKIVFKSWDGASSGNFSFAKTLISTIGLAENNLEELKVYPNPATDAIRFDVNEKIVVEIVNFNGQVLRTATVEANGQLDISGLNPGTYVVAARSATTNFVSKLIIQ